MVPMYPSLVLSLLTLLCSQVNVVKYHFLGTSNNIACLYLLLLSYEVLLVYFCAYRLYIIFGWEVCVVSICIHSCVLTSRNNRNTSQTLQIFFFKLFFFPNPVMTLEGNVYCLFLLTIHDVSFSPHFTSSSPT